jgi:uncharacterized protein (TIRG00374 family)
MVSQAPSRWRTSVGPWLGILVSLALVVWVLHTFDLAQMGRALQTANYLWLLPAPVLLVLNFALRALRWGTLFGSPKAPRPSGLFTAMMIGYLANNILPARAGELVRAHVLGQREGVAASTVLGTVVVERVADLVVALLLLGLVLLFHPMPTWLRRAGTPVAVVSLGALGFLASLNACGTRLVTWSVHVLRFLPANLLNKFEALVNGFIAGVSGLRGRQRASLFLACMVLIWCLETLSVWLIAQTFAIPLSIGGSLFVMLSVALGTAVPSSPGYIGTYEFFVTSALAALGISGGTALSFALVMHAVTFMGSSLLGVACLAWHGQKLTSLLAPGKE